jgi:hypothetical protein
MAKLTVSRRARHHEDRAGDPLDGLVNLFDLGIVLAVAFLLAALSSINVSPDQLQDQTKQRDPREVTVKPGEKAEETKVQSEEEVVGRGAPIGTVYQLEDGRQILVKPGGTPPTTTSAQPGGK